MSARRLLVTAGPTHEPIDEVRYLANRSSGRMGVAIAAAARDAGWAVTLLLGPSAIAPPEGCAVQRFETAAELEALLARHFAGCDVLVMAAAVADYRPLRTAAAKLPRTGGRLVLELEPVPDLVAACARSKSAAQRVVGFSLEAPATLLARAAEKLARKGLDAVVANPLATMGAERISPVLIRRDGTELRPPAAVLTKAAFAIWLVGEIERLLG